MNNFEEIAHKTVVELFDMLKAQMDEIKSLKHQIELLKHINDESAKNFQGMSKLNDELRNEIRNIRGELYRKTWKPYENLMSMAIESAIDEASKAVKKYKKNTFKEMRA